MSTAIAEPLTETNPNRPTEPGYCANCGNTPCAYANVREDYPLAMHAGTCRARPLPAHVDFSVTSLLGSDDARALFGGMDPGQIIDALIDWQCRHNGEVGTVTVQIEGRTFSGRIPRAVNYPAWSRPARV